MNARQTASAWTVAFNRLFSLARRRSPGPGSDAAPQSRTAPLGIFGCLSGVTIDPNRR